MELYKKYRPKTLEEIIGQPATIKLLQGKLKKGLPHSLLLSGPSGCGKTTLARILRKSVNCGKQDFNEVNCADFRGIDTVREIRQRMVQTPISGGSRVWLIDEAHKLSNDAQNALLKMLEDTPEHVYFFLATTEPQKLLQTIKTRCSEIKVALLADKDMESLVSTVVEKEDSKLPKDIVEKIVENSEGSPRKALVLLEQVLALTDKDDMLEVISKASVETQAIAIARALINVKTNWGQMAAILKSLDKEDPEQIRYMVLGYAKAVLLNSGMSRAFLIIEAFRDNFYDSKFAGLCAACYEVICAK